MSELTFIPGRQMARLRDNPGAFATAARLNALSMAARAGAGHLGGSFSAMDVMAWLYLQVMRPEDVFLLSKGHAALGLYAVLHGVGLLPDETLLTFRDGRGGLSAHPCLGTPGIVANTGSLGMGISKAKGMLLADRLGGVHRRYFVLVGDGELQEGQIWEALMPHAHDEMNCLTVIVDGNGLQGNGRTEATRPLDPLDADAIAAHLGHWGTVFDGHDAKALAAVCWRSYSSYPCLHWAVTTKGRGVSFMENQPGWHAGALSESEYRAAALELLDRLDAELWHVPHEWAPPPPPDPLVAAYGAALVAAAGRIPGLVVLDADLAKEHGLLPFRERYPERFIECGIAEQDMVSIASGMALRGLLPVVHSHAAFLTRRALDQVHNQVTEGTRVLYVGGSAGKLQPNGNGKSHETLVDAAVMALHGVAVHQPRRPEEVAGCLDRALRGEGAAYLRLLKRPEADQQFGDPDKKQADPRAVPVYLCADPSNYCPRHRGNSLVWRCPPLGDRFVAEIHPFVAPNEPWGAVDYVEDQDGTLVEIVETHRIPILKKLGWYLDLRRRSPRRRLPRLMLRALGLARVRD